MCFTLVQFLLPLVLFCIIIPGIAVHLILELFLGLIVSDADIPALPTHYSPPLHLHPLSFSCRFCRFTSIYQTASISCVGGRNKTPATRKTHTGPYVWHKRGFIHLCMPHLSVPIVCIPRENVCRWTGGGVREFHHVYTHTHTHILTQPKHECLCSCCFAEVGVFLLCGET